jgi:hypothetical protein
LRANEQCHTELGQVGCSVHRHQRDCITRDCCSFDRRGRQS